MTLGEGVSILSAVVSTGTLLFVGGRWSERIALRLQQLTAQVEKTNGSVTQINTRGCLFRQGHIESEEAIEAAKAAAKVAERIKRGETLS